MFFSFVDIREPFLNEETTNTLYTSLTIITLGVLLWHTVMEDIGGPLGDTEGRTEEGGDMVRYVHRNSGSYDYLKEVWRNVKKWIGENEDYLSTQIPYYSDYLNTKETAQYWQDYKKNTGFSPRYPRRAYGSAGTKQVSHYVRGFRNLKRLYG